MGRGVWEKFTELALSSLPDDRTMTLEMGGGETFLDFELFLECADHFAGAAASKQARVQVSAVTNGTLLDDSRLERLAARRVLLNFSIDGPEAVHDRFRRAPGTGGSFGPAFRNWRQYKTLASQSRGGFASGIQGVYTGAMGLSDLSAFWVRQGQPTFNCTVRQPGRSRDASSLSAFRSCEEAYLLDLENYAMAQAESLAVPAFLTDYRGPNELYLAWKRLWLGQEHVLCRPGERTMAVDFDGSLYPCDAFVGQPSRRLGTVVDGLDPERVSAFRAEAEAATRVCDECPERAACPKGCLGTFPERPLAESYQSRCGFHSRVSQIARRSLEKLSRL